jgi:hypothetical protein
MEMVVATAIVMIISVVVLTLLFILFKDNFSTFQKETKNILDTTEGVTARNSCNLACESESKFVYCCKMFDVLGKKLKCDDERLEVECSLGCEGFDCGDTPPIDPSGVGGT